MSAVRTAAGALLREGQEVDIVTDAELATAAKADPDLIVQDKYIVATVIPAMEAVRAAGDRLEKLVADDLWPLPKYEEMLFIK